MIILHDKKYPSLITFEIHSFLELDCKTFIKLFNEFIDKSHQNEQYYSINIDLYNINDYSIYNIKDITYYFTFLTKNKLKYIEKIDIYLQKNSSLLSLLKSVNIVSIMPINLIELDNKISW